MKIKPPKGYRLMRPNERPTAPDQYYSNEFKCWQETGQAGRLTVKKSITSRILAYARKKGTK